jgi:hypothetical protein
MKRPAQYCGGIAVVITLGSGEGLIGAVDVAVDDACF